MHYSSPILKSPSYIITYFWMHYICMCMYIMAYMCIYTDFHVMDLFMYYWYINVFIYLYIYAVFFSVWERMCVSLKPFLYCSSLLLDLLPVFFKNYFRVNLINSTLSLLFWEYDEYEYEHTPDDSVNLSIATFFMDQGRLWFKMLSSEAI